MNSFAVVSCPQCQGTGKGERFNWPCARCNGSGKIETNGRIITIEQQPAEPLADLAAARARIEALEAALRQARVGFYSIQQGAQGWKVLSFDQRSWALQDIYEGATIDLRLVDELLDK